MRGPPEKGIYSHLFHRIWSANVPHLTRHEAGEEKGAEKWSLHNPKVLPPLRPELVSVQSIDVLSSMQPIRRVAHLRALRDENRLFAVGPAATREDRVLVASSGVGGEWREQTKG